MKNRILPIAIAVFALALFVTCKSSKTITILHTNDTHSQIEPYITSKDTLGGVLRREQAIYEVRRQSKGPVFLFDAGDFSQGTPYFNLFGGDVEIEMMNIMGYDAATLGNHEFDNGLDSLAAKLKKAKFPVVCANYKFPGCPELEKVIKEWIVIERQGVKIGIFGLSPNMDGLTFTSTVERMQYLDPVEVSKKMVSVLREQRCDLIVCLSHLGYDPEPGRPMCDPILASQVHGIDLIVSGHTHIEKDTVVGRTHIIQTGVKGVNLGKVVITKTKQKGNKLTRKQHVVITNDKKEYWIPSIPPGCPSF